MKKYIPKKFPFYHLQVLKRVEANKVVQKTFKKCKSSGCKNP